MPVRLVRFACVALSLVPLSLAAAQESSRAPRMVRPGWYARSERLNSPTPSERAIIVRNLTAAERLVWSSPGYGQPRGFEVTPHWAGSGAAPPGGLRSYSVQIGVHVPRRSSTNTNPYATIHFNPDLGRLSDGGLRSESGEWYYHERPRAPIGYGATLVYGAFGVSNSSLLVLFTAHDQDPMLPVSREEYLRARIHEIDRDTKRAGANVTKTPYQQWMDGAAQRKKNLDQMLARLTDRDLAEKTRAGFEKQERETAEALKAREPRDVETKSFDPAGKLRDQLAAMTPQERASQAWAAGVDLMPAGAPGALRVVRVDPAFLRARGSAADARAILVILREPPPALVEAQTQLHRDLDWSALRRLLDTKP
jgi:hypothetical protein